MAWTSPLTAATDAQLTAAQWNSSIRDNLNETLPALSSDPEDSDGNLTGSIFITDGANSLAERQVLYRASSNTAGTDSGTYTDVRDVGPTVRVGTGTEALCFYQCSVQRDSTNGVGAFSVEVSGASSESADDDWAGRVEGPAGGLGIVRIGIAHRFTGLTAGMNRFTMKYRSDGSTLATFSSRSLIVWPL